MAKKEDISIKGLDDFSRKFLIGNNDAEYIQVHKGQTVKPEAIRRYQEERAKEFITRAGAFCDDLVGFIIEQKKIRHLSGVEVMFGLALANINLRNAYSSLQNNEEGTETLTPEKKEAYLQEFDHVCMGAQDFYDANT